MGAGGRHGAANAPEKAHRQAFSAIFLGFPAGWHAVRNDSHQMVSIPCRYTRGSGGPVESGSFAGYRVGRNGRSRVGATVNAFQENFLRQVFCSHLLRVPFGVPFFFLGLVALSLCRPAIAQTTKPADIETRQVVGSTFQATHEALVEAIEAEGLVVGAVIPFKAMLARTEASRSEVDMPYAEAEIVQFCSSLLAWQMVGEHPDQLALCPLSIAIHAPVGEPGRISLSWHSPGRSTAGRSKADDLLRRLVERTTQLARLRW